jgi:hypothetical protein
VICTPSASNSCVCTHSHLFEFVLSRASVLAGRASRESLGISGTCKISWSTPTMQSRNASSRNSTRTWVTSLIKRRASMHSCLPLLPPLTLILSLSAIESLEAPGFNRNTSTDLSRQRAVEHERSREASQNACPGMIKRMQFAFSTDTPPGSFPATSGLPPPPTPSRYLPPLAPNIIHYLPHQQPAHPDCVSQPCRFM